MKIIDDILYEMQEYLNQEVIDTGKETISDIGVGIECCMEIVKRIANEQDNDWIPCSEKLPERNKDVLCWVKSKTISGTETYIIGSCDNGFWFLKTYEIDRESFPVKDYKVIAWKRLPEPYKESDQE